jgi:hypothetical protein
MLYELDEILKGLGGVSTLRNQRADLVDRPEHLAFVAGHARALSKNVASISS